MSSKMDWSFLELAAKIAVRKKDGRHFFLGAVGIRGSDDVIVGADNNIGKDRIYSHHAEAKLARKLSWGSTVYVCRVRRFNFKNLDECEYGLARPCKHCQTALEARGVKKVIYSISSQEYGVLTWTNKGRMIESHEAAE